MREWKDSEIVGALGSCWAGFSGQQVAAALAASVGLSTPSVDVRGSPLTSNHSMGGQWCKRSIESCAWPAALADNQTHRVSRGRGASSVTNRSVTNRNPGMREGPISNLASTLEPARPHRGAIESTPR